MGVKDQAPDGTDQQGALHVTNAGTDDERDADHAQRRHAPGEPVDLASHPRPGESAGPDVPGHGQDPEYRHHVDGVPFHRAGRAEHHPGDEPPRSEQNQRPVVAVERIQVVVAQIACQSQPEPITIRDQRGDGGQHEDGLEDVQQRDPAHGEGQAIEGD